MTPQEQAIIIQDKIQEVPQIVTASKLGVCQQAVSQRQAKLRDLINKEASELLNRGLLPARRTLTRLAALGNVKGQDKDNLKLSLDASKVILSASGILASSGTTINNMIQVNTNEVPEAVKELLSRLTHSTSKSLVVEETETIDV